MYAGVFDVLGNGIRQHLTLVGHRIELDLLRPGHEFADDDRMLLGDFDGEGQEMTQFLFIVADVHGCT